MINLSKADPRLYPVPFNDFYQAFDIKICESEMENLINRYAIHNKDILSIGSGTAHEEYWFGAKGDNRLIFFDIDENGAIEPKLKSLSASSFITNSAGNDYIQYYIGDFTKFKKGFSRQFDVLYLSGFTPDELRRDAIKTAFDKRAKVQPWKKVFSDIVHREKQVDLNWPYWCAPFHESVCHSLSFVRPHGLIIIQSYCSDIDVIHNPNYVDKVKKNFSQHGITLLDLFYLEASPATALIVGFSGKEAEAKEFYQKQVQKMPLERFHGRSAVDNKAKQLYSLLGKSSGSTSRVGEKVVNLFKTDPRLYPVLFNNFYQDFDIKICEREIENLINRYAIHNMDILSIGSGMAHEEEYWFCVKGNNRLIFADIDERGTIGTKLKTISIPSFATSSVGDNYIQYYIGNFTKFKKEFFKQFDVLYLSNFTPDESRRDAIKTTFSKKIIVEPWKKIMFDMAHREKQEDLNWPYWCAPFHEAVYRSFSFVRPHGLIIIQSYSGGIDPNYNPNYVNKVKNDFVQHGVTLLDVFYFEASPAITLIVGFSGKEEEAKEYYQTQVQKTALERFHGRSVIDNKAKQFYSLIRDLINPTMMGERND